MVRTSKWTSSSGSAVSRVDDSNSRPVTQATWHKLHEVLRLVPALDHDKPRCVLRATERDEGATKRRWQVVNSIGNNNASRADAPAAGGVRVLSSVYRPEMVRKKVAMTWLSRTRRADFSKVAPMPCLLKSCDAKTRVAGLRFDLGAVLALEANASAVLELKVQWAKSCDLQCALRVNPPRA